MCYQYGSVEHYTAICPMCKVFRPSAAKCPHRKDICKNHAKDIVYLRNAEVQTFNGCGYCKWAKANPTKLTTHPNPGWAGCCRPPRESERVPPADWPAVAIVHSITVPADIRAILETVTASTPSATTTTTATTATTTPSTPGTTRSASAATGKSSPASLSRASVSPRTQPLSIPSKSRAGATGSPKEPTAQLATPKAATVLREASPDRVLLGSGRRSVDAPRGAADSPGSPSPLRKHIELEGSVVRPTDRRSSVSRIAGKGSPEGGKGGDAPALRRRASTAGDRDRERQNGGGAGAERRGIDRSNTISAAASSAARAPKRSSLDIDFSALSLTNAASTASGTYEPSAPSPLSPGSASSDGGRSSFSGSSSDGTVTSDGGFTDYLSDESEAELQRQAEARAALLAQSHVEDLEFRAARKQLAHVDLRPPRSWNPGSGSAQRAPAVEVGGFGRAR